MNPPLVRAVLLATILCCLQSSADIAGFGGNGSGWTLNSSPPVAGNIVQITDINSYWTARSLFFNEPQFIRKFVATFTWQNSTADSSGGGPYGGLYNPADGFVFTLQNQSLGAIGGLGSSLGYEGIALATGIAFNIYDGHRVGIGYAPTSVGNGSYSYSAVTPVNLLSLNPIDVTLTYDGAILTVRLEDTVTHAIFSTTYTLNLTQGVGGSKAYVGFTGATGAGAADQRISNFKFLETSTLGERAAELAKTVAGGRYDLGAKGWDTRYNLFVGFERIRAFGYYWNFSNRDDYDNSLDCSGLVFWSYNKAVRATKYQGSSNPVFYEGADGQYRNNTLSIREEDLAVGDLLFFDFDKKTDIDHVAMYVGCCDTAGNDVIQASSPTTGIIWSKKDNLKQVSGFRGYGRITTPKADVRFSAHSPVDLIVTDPDGYTITPDTLALTERERLREIPGILYYSIDGFAADGTPESVVTAPQVKPGAYVVKVVPRAGTQATDTYSLDSEVLGATVSLAHNAQINQIPVLGYGVQVSESGLTLFSPIIVDIMPGTIINPVNLKKNGVLPVAILSVSGGIDPRTIDFTSLRLGQAAPSVTPRFEDVNGDGVLDLILHFRVQLIGASLQSGKIELSGRTLAGATIRGMDAVSVVPQ
jgi:cell wall-associated NlpC family hydrolase